MTKEHLTAELEKYLATASTSDKHALILKFLWSMGNDCVPGGGDAMVKKMVPELDRLSAMSDDEAKEQVSRINKKLISKCRKIYLKELPEFCPSLSIILNRTYTPDKIVLLAASISSPPANDSQGAIAVFGLN